MKIRYEHSSRLFYLSEEQDLLLFLIRKELLGTKLMIIVEDINLQNAHYYDIELGKIILSLLGFKERSDDLWKWYHSVIKSHSENLILGNKDSSFEQSCRAYFELKKKLI